MQDEKKSKLKALLTKVLVVLVLVGLSVATYKVNLSQMLHDFVLRFFDAAMYEEDNTEEIDTEDDKLKDDTKEITDTTSEPATTGSQCSFDFIYELFGGVTVEASENESVVTKVASLIEMEALCGKADSESDKENKVTDLDDELYLWNDNLDKLQQLDSLDRDFLTGWIKEYSHIRKISHTGIEGNYQSQGYENLTETLYDMQVQRSALLRDDFDKAGMTVLDASCYYEVLDVIKIEEQIKIHLYEWTFVKYSMSDTEDIMGYGTVHTIVIDNYNVVADQYEDICESKSMNEKSTSVKAVNSYNPQAAVEYSDKYAISYNSSYSNYNSIGGDCANFVSQCLYAGGLKMTDGWYWKSYEERSGSWSYCPSQVEYMSKNCGTLVENPSDSQVLKGNPVYYYSASKNRYSHAAICVGVNSSNVPIVNAHNNDRYHVPWKLGSNWSKRSTVLISETPHDTTLPVISDVKIRDITNQGFTITMKVSDNVGISRVVIPVWTKKDGQDDIVWHSATVSDGIAKCYISAASHGYEGGIYVAHVYAYDKAENFASILGGEVTIDRSVPSGTKKGDATLDGKVNLADALYVLKLSLGVCRTDDITAADYDSNGKINLTDAKKVLCAALGID